MPLRNINRFAARIIRRASFLSIMACLPLLAGLLLFASSCMAWPGLTAVVVEKPGETSSNLPLLLALLGGGGGGSSGGGSVTSCQSEAYCRIFVTSTWWRPNGWTAVADLVCQEEANSLSLPGTYKSLLMTGGYVRNLSNYWVMYSNKEYRSASNGNAIVGTTDVRGTFTFPLANPISNTAYYVWTGIDPATWDTNTSSMCLNWTDYSASNTGAYGISNNTSNYMIGYSTSVCSNYMDKHLYCVQQ